jgi:hypothetical protein
MKDDQVLAELRAVRRKIVEECGGTEEGLCRRTLEVQKRYADRLAVPGPKYPVRLPAND